MPEQRPYSPRALPSRSPACFTKADIHLASCTYKLYTWFNSGSHFRFSSLESCSIKIRLVEPISRHPLRIIVDHGQAACLRACRIGLVLGFSVRAMPLDLSR